MKASQSAFVFFVLSMFFTNSMSRQVRAYDYKLDDPHPQKYEDIHLKHNRQVAPFIPSDIKEVSGQVGVHTCNEQGEYAYDPIRGCINYSSTSTNTSWRIRYGQAGAAIAIFKLSTRNVDGKKMQVPSLYVQFDANDINKVIYASAEASKYAQANGASQTQVVKGTGNSNPTQTGAPQQETPPQPSQRVNCKELSFLERVACEAAANVFKGK